MRPINKPTSEDDARWNVYFGILGTFPLTREEVAEHTPRLRHDPR
jgi:hypothetical protein